MSGFRWVHVGVFRNMMKAVNLSSLMLAVQAPLEVFVVGGLWVIYNSCPRP